MWSKICLIRKRQKNYEKSGKKLKYHEIEQEFFVFLNERRKKNLYVNDLLLLEYVK